jgi:hypothetical protein
MFQIALTVWYRIQIVKSVFRGRIIFTELPATTPTLNLSILNIMFGAKAVSFYHRWTLAFRKLTPASAFRISIPASVISVRYRTKKMPDWVVLLRYRMCCNISSFFHSGTRLIRCRTIRHSSIIFNIETKMVVLLFLQKLRRIFHFLI